ncbi:MAG: cellulose binding domain-containing protein [Chloroflexota bacterium]
MTPPTHTPTATATATRTPTQTPDGSDKPDLSVVSMIIELETGSQCPYSSTMLGRRVTFRNTGTVDINVPFVVQADTDQLTYSAGLAAGQSASLWFSGGSSMGEHTAIVDATSLIDESNETNNTYQHYLPIPTLPPCITITPTPITPTPTTPANACQATILMNSWSSGYTAEVNIRNNGNVATKGWQVVITFPGQVGFVSGWNGAFASVGDQITIRNQAYNGVIQPGGSTSAGFQGTGTPGTPTVTECTFYYE